MPPPIAPFSNGLSGNAWGLGLGLYGAQTIGRDTRAGDGAQHFTIIPLPVQPVDELTMQARADAIASTYSGLLMQAVDLYRLTVERNGFMLGILWMMSHGFLRLPLEWRGDPEMIAALTDIRDANGRTTSPGDFARMHPENEVAKIVSDGIGLGLGLGQYLLMCWRCDGIDWLKTTTQDPAPSAPPEEMQARAREISALEFLARVGDRRLRTVQHAIRAVKAHEMARMGVGPEREIETCKRCGACRTDRPVGMRQLYQLRWRDPRWLWRNTVTLQWYYTGRQGMIPITPGDGEWFMFQTVPDQDMWIHGPWPIGTEAAIFTRDARYDMQAISATCAPTHVFKFTGTQGGDPRVRADVDQQADNLRFQNKLVLPGEVEHRIDAATGGDGGYVGTADRITSWAQAQWEMVVTGIQEGTENGSGFADKGVLQRVSRERRGFYAGALIRQLVAQGLKWWAIDNFAGRPSPVGEYDTRSPEDKLAESKADSEEGDALKKLGEGWGALGYDLDPAYLEERAQRTGVRVQKQPGGGGRRLTWDPATQAAFVTIGQAIADMGLPPLPPGDPRAEMMVSAGMKPGGDKTPPAATPAGPPTALPPAAPTAAPQPGAPAARLDPEDCDECEDDEDCEDECARLAADMTVRSLDRCAFHGRTDACKRCGVRRVYALGDDGMPRNAWRPLRAARARPAAPAAGPARPSAGQTAPTVLP